MPLLPRYIGDRGVRTPDQARATPGLKQVVAIVSPGNARSVGQMEGLVMRFEKSVRLSNGGGDSLLFGSNG